MTTIYDTVTYPSSIFETTHPQRLRLIARIHGVGAPPVATARVLDIGGGDGLNMIALAAAWPDARFVNFDLAQSAVARGAELAEAAGLTNVDVVVGDIMTAHETYGAGSFDYVVAHGVYAWVPAPVRAALMRLIAHVLAPGGVAYVSYNALPGGHIRRAMRDMLLHALEGVTQVADRIAMTRQLLELFAVAQDGDDVTTTALRAQATSMLDRPPEVLFHDELGDVFEPQTLTQVVAAAEAVGLRFLSDEPGAKRSFDGFLADEIADGDDIERQVVRAAQAADYASVRYFRHTLFVRADVVPARRIDLSRLDDLWLSCALNRDEQGQFKCGQARFGIADEDLARMLDIVTARYPERYAYGGVLVDAPRRRALLDLFARGYVALHEGPYPFPVEVGERPAVSPLIRAMLADGREMICTLDHRMLAVEQPDLRRLLVAADGSRTIAELALAVPDFPAGDVKPALAHAARHAMLIG